MVKNQNYIVYYRLKGFQAQGSLISANVDEAGPQPNLGGLIFRTSIYLVRKPHCF